MEKSDISEKYNEFKKMFINNIKDLFLSKHEKWDHEIILESGIKSTFGPIYSLSAKELKMLRKYLNENLKKRHIRLLIFSAGYSIFFVFKKKGKLRLCVNYKELNNITVKNRYILFKINELLDRV